MSFLSILGGGRALAATCGSGYHYAGQTVFNGSSDTTVACPNSLTNYYYGYTGIDGAITTPSAISTSLSSYSDVHSLGYLDMQFGDGTWLQLGWMEGTVGDPDPVDDSCTVPACVRSVSQYKLYVEQNDGNGYSVFTDSSLGYSGSVTYRIQYDSTTQCWDLYYNYSTQAAQPDCFISAGSGGPVAANETGSGATGYVAMPASEFGSATSTVNAAIRIQGSSGYGAWQTYPTTAKHTVTNDDRSGTPSSFYYSFYSRYYHFLTYGATQ